MRRLLKRADCGSRCGNGCRACAGERHPTLVRVARAASRHAHARHGPGRRRPELRQRNTQGRPVAARCRGRDRRLATGDDRRRGLRCLRVARRGRDRQRRPVNVTAAAAGRRAVERPDGRRPAAGERRRERRAGAAAAGERQRRGDAADQGIPGAAVEDVDFRDRAVHRLADAGRRPDSPGGPVSDRADADPVPVCAQHLVVPRRKCHSNRIGQSAGRAVFARGFPARAAGRQ